MPSQLGQDRLVLDLLGGLRGGFFLDSGAANGVDVSNTYLLETRFGWNGICVEPDLAFFAALVKNRRCHCVNCCLYDREGPVEFIHAGYLSGIRETYSAWHLAYLEHVRGAAPHGGLCGARTVRSVLREFGAPSTIDYWSLDTEGSEFAILQSFPFDEFSFRVLTVEHNRAPVSEEIRRFLEPKGYRRIRTLGIDDCYVKDVAIPRPAWRSRARLAARR